MHLNTRFGLEPSECNISLFDNEDAETQIARDSLFPLKSPLLEEHNLQLAQEIAACQSPKYRSLVDEDCSKIIDEIFLGNLSACDHWFKEALSDPKKAYMIISVTDSELQQPPSTNIERLTVSVTDDEKGWNSENGMKYCLKRAFHMIDKARIEKIPLLIHCTAGKSRSCILLTAYLMWSTHQPFSKILSFIRTKRFWVCPSEALKEVLITDIQQLLMTNQ